MSVRAIYVAGGRTTPGAWTERHAQFADQPAFVPSQCDIAAELVPDRGIEHARSERLLLNVLPAPVAVRLKAQEEVIADGFDEVTILFADLVGFTPLSEQLAAADLVSLLDRIFAAWDRLAEDLGIEKIKTIGDAYMAAAGVPVGRPDHAEAIARFEAAI